MPCFFGNGQNLHISTPSYHFIPLVKFKNLDNCKTIYWHILENTKTPTQPERPPLSKLYSNSLLSRMCKTCLCFNSTTENE